MHFRFDATVVCDAWDCKAETAAVVAAHSPYVWIVESFGPLTPTGWYADALPHRDGEKPFAFCPDHAQTRKSSGNLHPVEAP